MIQDPLKLTIASLNGALLMAITALSAINFIRGNKKRSWVSAFHILCIVWLCFRQIFWYLTLVSHGPWSAAQFYLVYWLPHPIQFAMYLLVPLFYAKVLFELGKFESCVGKGDKMKKNFIIIRNLYIICIFLMVLFMIGCVVTAGSLDKRQYRCLSMNYNWRIAKMKENDLNNKQLQHIDDDADDDGLKAKEECFHIALSNVPARWLSAASFIFLAVVLLFYGHKIGSLNETEASRFFISDAPNLGRFNVLLFLVFMTRGIYEVGTLQGFVYLPELALNAGNDLDWRSFICMVIWDYFPLFVLMTMVSTASYTPGQSQGVQGNTPSHGGVLLSSSLSTAVYDSIGEFELDNMDQHSIMTNKNKIQRIINEQQQRNRNRSRSSSEEGNSFPRYGSFPKASTNWQSRFNKVANEGTPLSSSASSPSSENNQVVINPWSVLARQPSEETLAQQTLEFRIREGWSPSSSLDRVPIRDLTPTFAADPSLMPRHSSSSALYDLVENNPT